MNDDETKVLNCLAGLSCEHYSSFAPIMRETGLDRATVRRACRSLTRKGYAEYCRALWTEDGEPAGAGYAATKAGASLAIAKFTEKVILHPEQPAEPAPAE